MTDSNEITLAELVFWEALIDELLEVVRRRLADEAWTPTFMSQAEREIRKTAVLPRIGGGLWGRDPASTVYAAVEMLVHAVLDHVRSVHVLVGTGAPAVPSVEALARSAIEAASTAWWLTDPKVSPRRRVARLYVVRRASENYYQDAAVKMRVVPDGGYGKSVADLDAYYRDELGLTETLSKKGNWAGSEQQLLPGYTQRVTDYLKATGHPDTSAVYTFLSGASHGELWRLRNGYTEMAGPDGVLRGYQFLSREFLRVGIGIACESLVYSVSFPFDMLGRTASLHDIWRLAGPISRAFAHTE